MRNIAPTSKLVDCLGVTTSNDGGVIVAYAVHVTRTTAWMVKEPKAVGWNAYGAIDGGLAKELGTSLKKRAAVQVCCDHCTGYRP